MRKWILICTCLLPFLHSPAQSKTMTGFGDGTAKDQLALEQKFDQQLQAANIDRYIKEMSARPHHVGSPGGKAVADYIFNKYKEWGYDVSVETFYVLFPTPRTRVLEL